jgi:hypothetical protein
MASAETELILRALDDLRDDLSALRVETRQDFAIAFARLDETRQLVARIDERTDPSDTPPVSRRESAKQMALKHAPAAGVSALVVAIVELVPEIVKVLR